jgi:hypothetical protein
MNVLSTCFSSFLCWTESLFDGLCFSGKDNLPPSVITIIHQQRIQGSSCLSREVFDNRSAKSLIKTVDRRMYEATNAIRRGRFDRAFFTVNIHRGDEGILLSLFCQFVLTEPFDHGFLIREGCLMDTQKGANSGAVGFDGASIPVIGNDLLWGHTQLLSQMDGHGGRDIVFLGGIRVRSASLPTNRA